MTSAAGTVRAAAGMGVITAISRVVGLVRVLVVGAVLGFSYLGNAFQSANSLSNVLFELLAAGALSAVLVPAFVDLLDAGDQEGAEEVAGGVLGLALAAMGAISLVGVLAAPWLARLLTLGVDAAHADEQRELVTFLLRFFLPQVLLYAAGTVATGALYARRRFLPTAAAPIGNTVVMVAALLAFAAVAGRNPVGPLDGFERMLLVVAGTGGVIAFVGILLVSCHRSGFRLRPRWPGRDPRVGRVARQAGWGVVLHTSAGALLGGAIICGAGVSGGVVAYQMAWVFFLAPYGILAQPIHTAILPELVGEARDGDLAQYRRSVRWAIERMTLTVMPVAVALTALAVPAMRIVAGLVGDGDGDGARLLAAALASLAVGLLPYSGFLLLARAYYALGDSRTPGLVSLVVAGSGLLVMVVATPLTEGPARIAALGAAHSIAHVIGAGLLLVGLSRRAGGSVYPPIVGAMVAGSAVVAVLIWAASTRLLAGTDTRTADVVVAGGLTLVGAGILFAAYRLSGLGGRLTTRHVDPPGDPLGAPAIEGTVLP